MRARWGLVLWLVAVLALHAWVAQRWVGPGRLPPPPPRLQVQLDQALKLRPPPRVLPPPPRPKPSQLAAIAAPRLNPLPPPALNPLPPVPPLPEALLPPSSAEAAASAAPNDELTQARGGDPGPEWPPSTRLRYRVQGEFRGPVHGDAEVEWLRQGLHYQVRLRLQIGPSMTPFLSRELVSEGRIGERGIEPQRYDERTRLLVGAPRVHGFRLEGGWLSFAGGRQQEAPPGTQDSASQFVQMAWLLLSGRRPLAEGSEIEFPLALPRQLVDGRYTVAGSMNLETELGVLETWHLVPSGPLPPGALRAEVWLAPSANFLPVQFHIAQQGGEGAWVRLTLAEPPVQEAENAASQPASSPP